MDAAHFDALARWLNARAHRRAVGVFGASALGGIFTLGVLQDAEGKKKRRRKKKKCGSCRSKKKGKCKKHKPNGTPCGDGGTCQGGTCVVPACNPPCMEPATCVDGTCVFPDCDPECVLPATCVDGVCICPEQHVCDQTGTCCPEEITCVDESGCYCGTLYVGPVCSCAASETFCQSLAPEACCLDGDNCNSINGCVTSACSAGNAFCTLGWASCDGNGSCACFTRVEDGSSVCADIFTFAYCNSTPSCTSDGDCDGNDVCVDVSCCPGTPSLGVCRPPCAP